MLRRLDFTHTFNTRDLGGYGLQTGGVTRYNSFLRSDLPAELTQQEVDYLRLRKITTVVDLRSRYETEAQPSFFAGASGFRYHHCPVNLEGVVPTDEAEIPHSYWKILCNQSAVLNVFTLFSHAPDGVLFHCTAGKDRTGVIAALLLRLVGVPMPDVLADYQVSHTYIQPMLHRLRADDPTLPAWIGQSKPEYLTRFFDLFYQNFRSVEEYLSQIGLPDSAIQAIQNRFVTR